MVRALFTAAVLLPLVGCIIDRDRPCGKHQYYRGGECICNEGARLNMYLTGCVPCGPNEVGMGTACTCAPGFSRSANSGACEPVSAALGQPCSGSCEDETYSYCYEAADGGPYCTLPNCKSNLECGGGYGCDLRLAPSVCTKVPTGVGTSCASDADCADFEADHCEVYLLKTCLVKNCAGSEVECTGGSSCCDYSPLQLPLSVCVPNENLVSGRCPAGGFLVEE